MSGFGFTEAQEMFRREVRDFARRELAPGAKERARVCGAPRDILKKLADMGLLGISIPEKYGGQGADWVSLGIAIEELSKVDFFAGPKTRSQIIQLVDDHHTHHRAQLIIYLRLLGIKPPRYVGW